MICLAALFAITAATSSARLGPERKAVKCGLPYLAAESARTGNALSVASAQLYPGRPALADSLPITYPTPDHRFLIHYTLTGTHAIAWGETDTMPADDVPDFINEVAAALDTVWTIEIDSLGYLPPPADGGLGGDNRYDVYLYEIYYGDLPAFGLAVPDGSGPSSYIFIHPSFPEGPFGYDDPTIPMKVTLAHEFFHACQYVYNSAAIDNNLWLYESTAVWMEDQVFPHIDDYQYFLPYFFDRPWKELDLNSRYDFHMYGACVWPHYLTQTHDRGIIHDVWVKSSQSKWTTALNLYKYVLEDLRGLKLGDEFTGFTVWNYFTGDRAGLGPSGGYNDAAIYPEITEMAEAVWDSSWIEVTAPPDSMPYHLAANYFPVSSSGQNNTLKVTFSGDSLAAWRVPVLLDSQSGGWSETAIPIDSTGRGEIVIADWDKLNGLVIVTAASVMGGGPYNNVIQLEVADSNGIEAESRPTTLPEKLVLYQNYPNPFNPATNIVFDLPERAEVSLSIYDLRGHLVRRLYDKPTDRGRWTVVWDGRDEGGRDAASGVYFYRLESSFPSGARRGLTGRMVLVK